MTRVDVHQHLWPATLVEALRRRPARGGGPRLEGWTLLLDGEPPYDVDPAAHDLDARRAQDAADGVGLALLSLSCPLGIETLAPDEAAPLLEAWHGLAADLGHEHGLWAAVGLVEPDLDALATTLVTPGVCGLQVPATALASPSALERLAPVLEVVESAGLPVLVHPGPAHATAGAGAGVPGWWPALADYPAQQAAAWFAWHAAGRALLPRLRVAFVGLAGLAPLHHERLAQRGGALGSLDRGVFYETSSYGPRAIDAMTRVVGADPLVHGSDRPYAVPTGAGLGEVFDRLLHETNPHRLLSPLAPNGELP